MCSGASPGVFPYQLGQLVKLTTKYDKSRYVAQGILVSVNDSMFVDVDVKSVMIDSSADEHDLELPSAAGDGDALLSARLVNHVIKWKKERLAIKEMKRKKLTNDSTSMGEKVVELKQRKIDFLEGEKKTAQKEGNIAKKDDQKKTECY